MAPKKPMSKPTLILTRPLPQSQDFLLELSKMLGETPKCIISPLIEIRYLPENSSSSQPQALLFTSTNGVTAFTNVSDDRTPLALCVGPSTFRAATAAGFQAQNADGTADDLRQLTIQKLDLNLGKIISIIC